MSIYYAECVWLNKDKGTYEKVMGMAGKAPDKWSMSSATIIRRIRKGGDEFFLVTHSARQRIIVLKSPGKIFYLATEKDTSFEGKIPNSLICGPTCSDSYLLIDRE